MGVFALVMAFGPLTLEWLPMGVLALTLLFTSIPHYGATLKRVYDDRESRRRYALFSIWISGAMLLAFAVACHWYDLGSWFVTVYFNWSPWHYAGQNYGIALMFLHRRGVSVAPQAKKWLYASFFLAFLLSFIRINGAEHDTGYAFQSAQSTAAMAEPVYQLMRLGIPGGLQYGLMITVLVAYLTATAGAFRLLLRSGSARNLVPTACLVASQSLWFVVPTMFRTWNVLGESIPFSPMHHQYAFLLIATGHSVQYLWVTAYYAKREPNFSTTPRYFAQCVLVGCVIWYLPSVVFAPSTLGSVSFNDGLMLLVAAVVNIHHFILDGAVWKLRDSRVGGILLRNDTGTELPRSDVPRTPWIRIAVLATGVVCFAIAFTGNWEREAGLRRAAVAGDLERMRDAVARLTLIGQNEAANHRILGLAAVRHDEFDLALDELHKSIELMPHPKAWFEIGHIHASREQWKETVHAYESAYAIDSYPRKLIGRLAWALMKTNEPTRARKVLREGLALHPDASGLKQQLENVERRLREMRERAANRGGPVQPRTTRVVASPVR